MAGRFHKELGDIKYAAESLKDLSISEAKQYNKVKEEVLKQFGGTSTAEMEKVKYNIYMRAVSHLINEE